MTDVPLVLLDDHRHDLGEGRLIVGRRVGGRRRTRQQVKSPLPRVQPAQRSFCDLFGLPPGRALALHATLEPGDLCPCLEEFVIGHPRSTRSRQWEAPSRVHCGCVTVTGSP